MYVAILKNHIVRNCWQNFYLKCKIHQDNDSKHNAIICRYVLKNYDLKWVKFILLSGIILLIISSLRTAHHHIRLTLIQLNGFGLK
jgi:hypothetical protein